ncbi:MAG: tyrosine--tRNA ligase [Candidatus Nanoarchaeia archaeon]
MENEEKIYYATRNTQEIVTEEELKRLLEEKNEFHFYWGIAPTGSIHIGYFVPIMKIFDLLRAGGKGKILIADYHGFLDDQKTPWEQLRLRSKYYEVVLRSLLEYACKRYLPKIEFIRGSEFQTKKEYIEDVFKLAVKVSIPRAMRAASSIVRRKDNPHVSELLYPLMQIVDVKYMEAEVVVGGIDQRHVYMLGRENMDEIGGGKYVSIFTPLLKSLTNPKIKMSASIPESSISVVDNREKIREKILKAYCPERNSTENPVMDIVKYLLIPIFEKIEIETKSKGRVEYKEIRELERNFVEGKIHPFELKESVIEYLNKLLDPIRSSLQAKDYLNLA